ncbi:hypothetical protein [Deinococcus roseus]|uniref:Transposase n=1 Tax=Deinococcus roseus TaxID=392414 RepID=A0ABQ2CTF5_9DEIO|nr:hypothetical protein [Deinococcus roseus]GGJ18952.1 hypothetical protein GCM10008938_01190 [Deinococcus roseus]
MLRIEYRLYPNHAEAGYMNIDLQIFDGEVLLFSEPRLYMYNIFGLRNWFISDFYQQKSHMVTDDVYAPPLVLGLVFLTQKTAWTFLTRTEDDGYQLCERNFSEREMARMLEDFFHRLRLEMKPLGIVL